ncbi:MAG: hypothetical protein KAU14_07335, partial [Thermoplasmata archaeon]|nr:hypothetical protein [Thermoplasmata archaeon]
MKSLYELRNHKLDIHSRRGLVFTISLLMLAPVIMGLLHGPGNASGEIGDEDALYWPQFQRTAAKDAVLRDEMRGISDPVIKWDKGLNVLSMGTTAADFRENIRVEGGNGEYDRDVVHLLFCAEDENGNTTIYIVDGDTGETAWALDMGNKKIEAGPVAGYLNDDRELDIVFATTDGVVYALEPVIRYHPDKGEGDRYSWDSHDMDGQKLWAYETDDKIEGVSPLLTDLTPNDEDPTMDVVITTMFSDTHSKIYALNGSTRYSDGHKLWEKKLEGELPSTPSSLVSGDDTIIWTACYDDGDQKEYLYRLKNGKIGKTVTEDATRGTWDKYLPSPVIADIDGNGNPDIVLAIPIDPHNSEDYGSIYVYDDLGRPLDNWKYGIPVKGRIGATPVVGDLKGDGKNYIVVQAWYISGTYDVSTVVTAFKRDGTKLWSKEFNTNSDAMEDRAVSSPVLFDLDQNGKLDVIAATNPRVLAFDGTNGAYMEGFYPGAKLDDDTHELFDSPAIGDFNRDGIFDIAIDSVVITQNIAELEAGDISFDKKHPEAGDKIRIEADVYNNGTADAANVLIRFMDGNTTIAEDTHTIRSGEMADPIPVVEDYEVTEGWHTFKVIVDPDNEIEEVNKTNNVFERSLWVSAPYELEVHAPVIEKESDPDSTASFRVQINNTGTRDDYYSFNGSGLPEGWNYSIPDPLEANGTVFVESHESENITVDIHVPFADAHSRETLNFSVMSENSNNFGEVNLSVVVRQVNGVKLEVIGDEDQKASPGGQVDFYLEITNTGNGMDNYSLKKEGLPSNWSADFNVTNLNNVERDGVRNARFTLTAPNASELDSGNQEALLKLTVSSKDNTSVEEEAQIKAKIAQLV